MVEHAITVFMAFFAIMNPIANTTVFSALAGNKPPLKQRQIASKALIITFVIIVLFAVLGKVIFHLFGISLPAFRITGGILIFIVGFHMLHGVTAKLHSAEGDEDTDVAISPMAVPLLAGPGTIATAMNYSAGGSVEIIITVSMFAVLCAITFVCFIFSSKIVSTVGAGGLSIVTRLMGLILAVIGVQMLVEGIQAAFMH